MIIIEGPDTIGKTWLANKLVFELNALGYPVQYSHMSRPPQGFDYYWGYVEMMRRNVVMDRFHLGEIVYRPISEHMTYQTSEQLALLHAKLRTLGAFIVVCAASDEFLDEQLAKRVHDNEMFSDEQIRAANRAYRKMLCGHYNDFEFDVDLGIHVSRDNNGNISWPCNGNHVQHIVRTWIYKQQAIDTIHKRRPACGL